MQGPVFLRCVGGTPRRAVLKKQTASPPGAGEASHLGDC